MKKPVLELFIRGILKHESGCWEWQKARDPEGYGHFVHDNKTWRAHRWAYHHLKESIPPNVCVLHHCDNPPCVNPEHLFLGTQQDNRDDAEKKGRYKVSNRKLKADQVLEIRVLRNLRVPRARVAEMFKVGVNAIEDIEKGRTYRWVK